MFLVGVLTAVPGGVLAQPGGEASSVPLAAWGDPDLRGVWANSSLTPLERPPDVGDKEFYSESDLRELDSGAAERWIQVIPSEEWRDQPRVQCGLDGAGPPEPPDVAHCGSERDVSTTHP